MPNRKMLKNRAWSLQLNVVLNQVQMMTDATYHSSLAVLLCSSDDCVYVTFDSATESVFVVLLSRSLNITIVYVPYNYLKSGRK